MLGDEVQILLALDRGGGHARAERMQLLHRRKDLALDTGEVHRFLARLPICLDGASVVRVEPLDQGTIPQPEVDGFQDEI